MMESKKISRRSLLAQGAAALGAVGLAGRLGPFSEAVFGAQAGGAKLKGRLKQSVARWCYSKIPLDEFARECAAMGLKGIDLLNATEWDTVKKYGLVPTMMLPGGGTIPDGLNRKENHDKIE